MAARSRGALGLLLALIDAGRYLAPPSRRRDWRRQWRADIWHEWQWRSRREGFADRAALFTHLAGALKHACWLRLHVRRIEMITHDLRYGWRLMIRRPAFTAAAVLTLGLGIGANVTMFTWMDTTLRRQLRGVADADRFVVLNSTTSSRADLGLSFPDVQDFRQRKPASVDDVIAFTLAPMHLRTESGEAVRVFAQLVTGNFFDALDVHAALGRGFLPTEDAVPNRDAVAVLSHTFWEKRFAADRSIIGRVLTLNGRAFTVVGVAPPEFRGTEPYLSIDLWVPTMMQQAVVSGGDRLRGRGYHWLEGLVKLAPGVGMERAQADLDLLARDLAVTYPESKGGGVKLYEPWRAPTNGGGAVVAVMGIQLGVAMIVLLIACANVANLLLASAAARQRETAVRLALGAGRARLIQQLLTESTLLSIAGGLVGVAMAYWTKDLMRWFVPPVPLPIDLDPQLRPAVLLFSALVTAATAFIFGLVPALQGSSTAVVTALKEAGAAITASPRRARLRQALVVAQVALSLVLLVSAGLFVRALSNAQAVDPGFTTRSGLLAAIDLQPTGYDAARGRAFQQTLLSRVREIPGVEAASFAQGIPLGFGGSSDMHVAVDGYTPRQNEEMFVYYNRISSDYLKTMGIALVAGREFTERDRDGTPDVVVINQTFARGYFNSRDPIGGHVRVGQRSLEVVGVARDGKYGNITEAPRVFMYLPLAQWYRPDAVLHVRTAGDPAAAVPALHAAVRSLDASIPLFDVRTIAEHLQISVSVQRMVASLLGAFGLLALVLATVGLYGVIAAIASQRVPEIGMRMALGATRRDIVALILRQGLSLTIAGIAIGLLTSIAATRAFRSLLVGVSATDAATFAATTVLLMLVALAAVYFPARRAASIDPIAALRGD